MLPPFATASDAIELGLTVTPANLQRASSRIRTYLRSVRYPETIVEPTDDLIELTCQIADRIGTTSKALAAGVQQQQQTASQFQQGVTYGWDAWKAQSGLTAGELTTLRRMFPAIPRTISMGSPVDLHTDEPA